MKKIILQKRFTLIELLVVIAMMAILASMLLPALGKARRLAYDSQCMNNQKQLYVYLMLYADSYKDWSYGASYNENRGAGITRYDWALAKLGFIPAYYSAALENRKMLQCPMAQRYYPWDNDPESTGRRNNNRTCNYIVCGQNGLFTTYSWIASGEAKGQYFKPATSKNPSYFHWANCSKAYSGEIPHGWHGNGKTKNMFLFVAGNIRTFDILKEKKCEATRTSIDPVSGAWKSNLEVRAFPCNDKTKR